MNEYLEMKERHQKEFNDFPCFFAFNTKQFDEGMEKLGLTPDDTDKVFKGCGSMIYRKTDSKILKDMMDRQAKERKDAIKSDINGNQFIYRMFDYELANHEYCITCDDTDSLSACGISQKDLEENENLRTGLELAKSQQYDAGAW